MSPVGGVPSRVLITQAHLVRLMGSEIVTLELAEHFAAAGADVVVVSYSFGGVLRERFGALPGVRVFELPDPDLDVLLAEWTPDLAWVHHSLVPRQVLERAAEVSFVFHHMSSFLPIERSIAPDLESQLASAVTFVSPLARDRQLESGLYAEIEPDRIQLFENPAPRGYDLPAPDGAGRRLLVVSNHLPPELVAALPRVRERWDVEIIGSQRELGAVPRLVDPEVIGAADAVLSIGKTVPFALAARRPVYLYDHFGGPGWVRPDNSDAAREGGFSGRGFSRKTAIEIRTELVAGPPAPDAAWPDERWAAGLRLADRMDDLLEFVRGHPRRVVAPAASRIRAHDSLQAAFGSYVREWIRRDEDARLLAEELEPMRAREAVARQIPGHGRLWRVLDAIVEARARRSP